MDADTVACSLARVAFDGMFSRGSRQLIGHYVPWVTAHFVWRAMALDRHSNTPTRRNDARRFGHVLPATYSCVGKARVIAGAEGQPIVHGGNKPSAPTKLRAALVCVRVAAVAAGSTCVSAMAPPLNRSTSEASAHR
jgi:hypothetical protein